MEGRQHRSIAPRPPLLPSALRRCVAAAPGSAAKQYAATRRAPVTRRPAGARSRYGAARSVAAVGEGGVRRPEYGDQPGGVAGGGAVEAVPAAAAPPAQGRRAGRRAEQGQPAGEVQGLRGDLRRPGHGRRRAPARVAGPPPGAVRRTAPRRTSAAAPVLAPAAQLLARSLGRTRRIRAGHRPWAAPPGPVRRASGGPDEAQVSSRAARTDAATVGSPPSTGSTPRARRSRRACS